MTDSTDNLVRAPGLIFYDGTCSMCTAGVARYGPMMRRRGFRLEPLQSAVARPFVTDAVDEMKVVTRAGRVIGGAEGIAYLCRRVWWAWPVGMLWWVVPLRPVFRWWYGRVAVHRHCKDGVCRLPQVPAAAREGETAI